MTQFDPRRADCSPDPVTARWRTRTFAPTVPARRNGRQLPDDRRSFRCGGGPASRSSNGGESGHPLKIYQLMRKRGSA